MKISYSGPGLEKQVIPTSVLFHQSPAESVYMNETPEQRDERMAWWREGRFGMFIHWGLYAIPAGQWQGKDVPGIGEWIMHSGQIPVEEYEPLAGQFNPVKFDAKEWVSIAKNAGMKYIVITSKHHDGFCLFDSKLTDYDVMDASPFKRDIMKELSEECKRQGLRMCWYHSIMDWHHPDYLPRRPWEKRSAEGADYERYVNKYLKGQIKELLTNYGPIGIMWFDGEWEKTWDHEHGLELYDYVRSLQKDILVNNRVDKGRQGMEGLTKEGGYAGDYGTPEQEIPSTGLAGVDWESCMTMNDTWGFKKTDHNWKSSETMIRMLADTASKGGNFLLNVGPTAEGLIPAESVERLAKIGEWLKVNSESIYGTTASPFKELGWGRCTSRAGKLYLHVFEWPTDGKLKVPGLMNKVQKAYLLADKGQELAVTQSESEMVISVPTEAPDGIDTVVVMEIEGEAQVK